MTTDPDYKQRGSGPVDESKRYRVALQAIRDRSGKVCDEFEFCTHRACASSYEAWAIADAALREPVPGEEAT